MHLSSVFLPAVLLAAKPGASAGPPVPHRVVLDGRFDDWTGVPVAVDDPADAPGAAIDFRQVRIAHEGRFVHFLVDLGHWANLQDLSGTIELLLDADADAATGQAVRGMAGVDAIVQFTAQDPKAPDRARRGLGLTLPVNAPPPGDRTFLSAQLVGLAHAPTYADRQAEIRLERGAALPAGRTFLAAPRFAGRLDFLDARENVEDMTAPFTYEPGPLPEPQPIEQRSDPLERPANSQLRVVSWNVRRGHLLEDPEPFGRILAAIDPDIVLFQELMSSTTPQQVTDLLDRWLVHGSGAHWNAVIGTGGTDIHCAVASRLPLRPFAGLEQVPYPDIPDKLVRIAAAQIDHDKAKVLAVSVHLTCCGHAGSFEDRARQIEADAIARALRDVFAKAKPHRLIIAGDFNLVGSRRPLDLLVERLDVDGSDLAIAETYQLDGLTDATWSDPATRFGPGRLDFFLYGDSTLRLERAIALDSGDLSAQWLMRLGIRAGDSEEASDHLPVVADLRSAPRKR